MVEKKRILLIGNCYTTVAGFREELIIGLVKSGMEVYIAFPNHSHGELESGRNFAEKTGCHYIEIKMNRRSSNLLKEVGAITHINKLIADVKPDCVLLFTIKPNIYGGILCQIKKIPYIINITGRGSGLNQGALRILLSRLYVRSMNKAYRVFFQNRNDYQYFINAGYKRGTETFVPGSGVNLEKYAVLPYPNSDCVNILYTARVMKEKGIDEFIGAAKAFEKDKNVTFEICGDCEEDYLDELTDLDKKEIIKYNGRVSDVRPYIAESACVVIPTFYHEGVSNCLLEAAACARPIITTNLPGSAETVEDGVTGYLIKEKDIDELVKSIRSFINLSIEDRRKMGLAGRIKVEKEFDRRFVVDKYLNEIRNILGIST